MKGFAIKALISEMVSLGEGEKTVEEIVFLAGSCREEVLMIKDEVEARYVVEVEVGVSGFSKEKLLVTGTGTPGGMREVEGIEARVVDEERMIAVKEIIVLIEGTRGVGEEEV